jgi:hypothetical protein
MESEIISRNLYNLGTHFGYVRPYNEDNNQFIYDVKLIFEFDEELNGEEEIQFLYSSIYVYLDFITYCDFSFDGESRNIKCDSSFIINNIYLCKNILGLESKSITIVLLYCCEYLKNTRFSIKCINVFPNVKTKNITLEYRSYKHCDDEIKQICLSSYSRICYSDAGYSDFRIDCPVFSLIFLKNKRDVSKRDISKIEIMYDGNIIPINKYLIDTFYGQTIICILFDNTIETKSELKNLMNDYESETSSTIIKEINLKTNNRLTFRFNYNIYDDENNKLFHLAYCSFHFKRIKI